MILIAYQVLLHTDASIWKSMLGEAVVKIWVFFKSKPVITQYL